MWGELLCLVFNGEKIPPLFMGIERAKVEIFELCLHIIILRVVVILVLMLDTKSPESWPCILEGTHILGLESILKNYFFKET